MECLTKCLVECLIECLVECLFECLVEFLMECLGGGVIPNVLKFIRQRQDLYKDLEKLFVVVGGWIFG